MPVCQRPSNPFYVIGSGNQFLRRRASTRAPSQNCRRTRTGDVTLPSNQPPPNVNAMSGGPTDCSHEIPIRVTKTMPASPSTASASVSMRMAQHAKVPTDVKAFGLGGTTFYEESMEKVTTAATVAVRSVFVSTSTILIDIRGSVSSGDFMCP